jgi:subtilase family serine protease
VSFLANTVAPLVHTADQVISVVGLNTLQRYSTPDMRGPGKSAQDQCIGSTCTGNLNPSDLWGAYDLPSKYEGAGHSIAIIGEGLTKNIGPALRKFEKANKLPQVPVHAHCVEKGSCGTDQSGEVEWFLDTQASTGMAPLTKSIELYFSQEIYDHSLNQAFIGWIDDPRAPRVANASLIECEQTPLNPLFTKVLAPLDGNNGPGVAGASIAIGNDEEQVLDPQLIKIALQGKTLFASAGDGGSSCALAYLPVIGGGNVLTNDVVPMTNYPAVSPWVVAVGGTALTTTASGNGGVHRQNEFGDTYGGGGTSLWEAAPPWQALEPNVRGHCLASPDGSTTNNGKLCRGVPDVAAIEGEGEFSFYNIYGPDGYLYGEGGTSLSSPLWAGVWNRVVAAAKHPLGNAGPLLYLAGTNATTYKRDFYDITFGPNGLYSPGPGWDYVTGFGAPDGVGLIKDIALAAPPVR